MSGRFDGHAAVVTGAGNGIGRATAEEFAREGAAVAVVDIEAESAQLVAAEISSAGGKAIPVVLDVSDQEAAANAMRGVANDLGGIDHLVNCAVSFIAKGADVTTADWERSLGVNVRGGANLVQACREALARSGRGTIVNTTSISAYIAQPSRWTYNASKAAIVNLSRCQALDLAAEGIRVNSVSPGWIWTREVSKAAGGDRERWEPVWGKYHLLRRLGEPREVARAILFLSSDDASFITGTDLAVDGGYRAMGPEGLGETSAFAGSE